MLIDEYDENTAAEEAQEIVFDDPIDLLAELPDRQRENDTEIYNSSRSSPYRPMVIFDT